MTGVSFVVPVRNGAPWIRDVVGSIDSQGDGRPLEIIVVDDASTDDSREIAEGLSTVHPLRIIAGQGNGPAAAINTGVRAAQFPVICQVDQDVVLHAGWMRALTRELDNPKVAAAQGYYTAPSDARFWGRVMSLDVEQRYAALPSRETTHVCTGNVAYRAAAIDAVGLFDETLGYGLDNDMSYRLQEAGYRLVFCPDAKSTHYWRDSFLGYCRQQYGLGSGRLDLVAKHPRRIAGDSVSPLPMMLHPVLMTVALLSAVVALGLTLVGDAASGWNAGLVSVTLLGLLGVERGAVGIRAALRFRAPEALLFPIVHFVRDLAWVCAIATWVHRRLIGQPPCPEHTMRPRPRVGVTANRGAPAPAPRRIMGLIPAHNEGATLSAVVAEARKCCPALDLLIVDDGSTDSTVPLLETLDVRWIRLPEQMGVGSAVRAGLRFATRLGYDGVVRLDGDGQHRPADVAAVLEPLRQGQADVVMGSRFVEFSAARQGPWRHLHRLLAVCLSALTHRPVTDPTSGFCALGPRAVRLLAEHHPTGYPEPELQLLVTRNGLTVVEVPVRARPRLGGRTSLTPIRIAKATARVLLAMMIVPLRGVVADTQHD